MGANDFTLEELEALFQEEVTQEPQPVDNDQPEPPAETTGEPNPQSKVDTKAATKAFSDRLNKEREAIAKTMGFNSYEAMIKSKEEEAIKAKGYDPKDLEPLVEEMLKTRLENDPRMQELETLRKKQVEEYALRELAEIEKLTGGEVKTMEQLPKAVVELWAKTGSLKAAYLQLEGEKLIVKAKAAANKGGTSHLQNPSGAPAPAAKTRPLTAEEKVTWKFFNPHMTDEELNKKQLPIQ